MNRQILSQAETSVRHYQNNVVRHYQIMSDKSDLIYYGYSSLSYLLFVQQHEFQYKQ